MTARTQRVALLLLVGLWAGLVLWVFVGTPESQHVPLKYGTGQKASREAGRSQPSQEFKVRVDLLDVERRQAETALGTPKNIFAPLLQAASNGKVAVARRKPTPAPKPPTEAVAVPKGPTPEELAAQAAQAELAQFRYLGYLSRQGREEAFLSKGKELHIVRAGDTIEQRVLVKAVSPTGVSLQETRTQVEKTLLLAGDGQ